MVNRVLRLLYREIRGLHQAAYILALFAFASQMLALVRDRILAHQFGAGLELDIYYAAFRIPDIMFVLFASVLSVYVLLPFVSRSQARDDTASGGDILSQVFSLFLITYSVVAALIFVSAPWLVTYLFPGFGPADQASTALLVRVLLLQPLLLGLSSLLGVVTQLSHRFVVYALSPLLYNIGIIFGAAVLYPWFGLVGIVYGVVLGAVGHMAVQLPLVYKSEFRLRFTTAIDWRLIRRIGAVAIPRAFTLSLNQLLLLVLISLASVMTVGSVAVFQFAFNLQSVPLAIIGMSYSVAAFPTLAALLANQKQVEFNTYVITALRHIIFWSLPVIALVVVLRAQIVRVLLGSGSFDWNDTRLVAAVLAIFVVTLAAQAMLLLMIRAFYAGGRTRIPFVVTFIGAACGALAAWMLYQLYQTNAGLTDWVTSLFRLTDVPGAEVLMLPVGFALGVVIEVILMLYFLRRTFGLSYRSLARQAWQATLAALVGGLSAYSTLAFIVEGVNQDTFLGIFIQGVSGGVMGVVGVVLTYVALRSPELHEIYGSFRTRIFKTDVVAPQQDVL